MPDPATDEAPLAVTTEAASKLRSEADSSGAVLSIRHLLGCGANGLGLWVEENAQDEGHRFEASGIPVVMDDSAFQKLRGATLEVGNDPNGQGYRLNHPDALMATFC